MSENSWVWPWQYNFPPFFTLQIHSETRNRQICAWRNLVLDYFRTTKECLLDVSEATQKPPLYNASINRRLDMEFVMAILSDLQRTQNAAPIDRRKKRWEIYWHTLEEWANIIYTYIKARSATNSVFTLTELIDGDEVQNEEFFKLPVEVLIKVLRILESQGKCELMLFDNQQGVKFF